MRPPGWTQTRPDGGGVRLRRRPPPPHWVGGRDRLNARLHTVLAERIPAPVHADLTGGSWKRPVFHNLDLEDGRIDKAAFVHINFLGSYTFPTEPASEALRPLRDPDETN